MQHYFDALARLKDGKSKIVPKGTRITNDAVSLEAGCKKGSIKKQRPQFQGLILAIQEAASLQKETPEQALTKKLDDKKEELKDFRKLYEEALSRELSLVQELFEVKCQLAKLTGENIIPIRRSENTNK